MSDIDQKEAENLAAIRTAWREDFGESPAKLQDGYNEAAMAMSQIHIWCRTPEDRAAYKRRWQARLSMIQTLALVQGVNLEPIDGPEDDDDA